MSDVGLDAELNLDISRALESVTEIETALTTATTDVALSFDLSGVEAMQAAVDAALGSMGDTAAAAGAQAVDEIGTAATSALTDVPVTADPTDAEAALAELADEASKPVDMPVTADTSDAINAIDGVQEQAAEPVDIPVTADTSQAESSVGDLKGGIEGLHAASEAAVGSAGGLASAIGEIHPAAAVATGGAIALSGATKEFFEAGVEATGAAQRFETVVGEMADRIKEIHVGDLNTDMEHLGLEFGSTTAAMENANSKLFSFAINAGASQEQAVAFTQQVEALSARALSLNPNLGTLSDVMEQMGPRLARGGRFASEFGVALTPAEINARALADTGKQLTSELTVQEKAMAGAEIAAERYGNGLSETVSKGAENAINQQKSLSAIFRETIENIGRPLVAPMFDVIKAAEPDVALLGDAIGSLVEDALPLLSSLLTSLRGPLEVVDSLMQVLGPPLQLVATIIDAMPQGVTAAVAGFFAFRAVLSAVAAQMEATTIASMALETSINPVAGLLAAGAAAFSIFGGSSSEASNHVQDLTAALTSQDGVLHTTTDDLVKYIETTSNIGKSGDELQVLNALNMSYADLADLSQQGAAGLQTLTDRMIEHGFAAQGLAGNILYTSDAAEKLTNDFKDLQTSSQEAAKTQIESALAANVLTEEQVNQAESQHMLTDGTVNYVGALNVLQPTLDAAAAKQKEQTDATDAGAKAAQDHADAVAREEQAVKDYTDAMRAAIDPWFALLDASTKNAEANDKVTEAQNKLNDAVKAHGPNSKEAADATRELSAAQVDAAKSAEDQSVAQAELEGKVRDGSVTLGDAKNQLAQWVAQGAITQQTADAMAAKFQYVEGAAHSAAGNYALSLSLDDNNTLDRLHQIGQLVYTLASGVKTIEVDIAYRAAPGQARAEGGPIEPDISYLVGERGPELFVSKVPGVIVPANVTSALTQAVGPPQSATVSTQTMAGGARIEIGTANFGSEGALADLDWWATTREGSI